MSKLIYIFYFLKDNVLFKTFYLLDIHKQNIYHMDIKPANVMLGKYGETLVVDWGLAKSIGRSDDQRGGEVAP